jgi:hypothetical protein
MQLKKATRKQSKIRIGMSGPPGGGKTFSALLLAYGLTSDWSKIAVIDTENGSASLYSHLGEFLTIDLQAPYSPERFIEAIKMCEKEDMEVIIIDSASHEWSGIGGCLEINDTLASAKYKGNGWAAWNETTPRHDKFTNAWLNSSVHTILCTRSKVDTVMGDDKKVKKIGMKDIQREGLEYEFTIAFNLDREKHYANVSKDRTNLFDSRDPFVISVDTGKEILEWATTGENEIDIALKEVSECEDITSLQIIWSNHSRLQNSKVFIASVIDRKLMLSK